MKKFFVTYHAPASDLAEAANGSPEERAEGMKPWMAWAEKCGSQLIDMGTPLMGGQTLSPDGFSSDSNKEVCGYSILEAGDMEGAKALMEGHPHLSWTGGCQIEVHESVPL